MYTIFEYEAKKILHIQAWPHEIKVEHAGTYSILLNIIIYGVQHIRFSPKICSHARVEEAPTRLLLETFNLTHSFFAFLLNFEKKFATMNSTIFV